jgi:uncharacterized protein YvpB
MSEPWKRNLPVPYFSQRECTYEWQRIATADEEIKVNDAKRGIEARRYLEGESIGFPVSLAWASCNITSLCMILHYFGITDDTPDQMMEEFFKIKFTNPENNAKYGYDFRHEAYAAGLGPNRLEKGGFLKQFVHEYYNLAENYIKHSDSTPLTLNDVQDYIAKGYPVWISYGVLTAKEDRDKDPNARRAA